MNSKPPITTSHVLPILYLFVGFLATFVIVTNLNRLGGAPDPFSAASRDGQVAGIMEERGFTLGAFRVDAPTRREGFPDASDLLTARSVFVMDAASGAALFAKNEFLSLPLASLTKLVTATVSLEGSSDLDATTTILEADLGGEEVGSDRISPGEVIRNRDLLHAALVGSSNTATRALVRSSDLSTAEFVARMNDLASSLGLAETRFVEPTGLDPGNVSTAPEIARLAEYAFRSTIVRRATTLPAYEFSSVTPGTTHRIVNTDKLLGDGLRVLGGKTGSLTESRYSFVTLVSDESGNGIIVAVLGADTDDRRFVEAKALASWTFESFEWPARE